MAETLFEELKRYVNWSAGDEAALRALHPAAQPHFEAIANTFYARILDHDGARKALVGGESVVGRLKVTLQAWMDRLLSGPWDEDYFEARCRIGRVHVRINLPQHYMFGAMNVVRRELNALVHARYAAQPQEAALARMAVGKVLDLELAIMLHTYREDLLSQQARAERLATFGQLVGSIGHELRNPLGVIETSLYILRGRIGEDERAQRHVTRISEQLGVANGIISNLLDMIRDRPLAAEQLDLGKVVHGAAEAVRRPEHAQVTLASFEGLPRVLGDATQLRQVFVNLIENGVQAAGARGEVRVEGQAKDGQVEVSVEDTGPGVDPATLQRLFEPLISTKDKGIGLGLALVKRIVERHRGTVSYEPRRTGARFVVRIPSAV